MEAGTNHPERVIPYDEHRGWWPEVALWIGMLGGPFLFLLNLQTLYALVPRVCHTHHPWPLYVMGVVYFVLTLACAWSAWSQTPRGSPQEHEEAMAGRHRLMGYVGLMTSFLSALVILAHMIASWMLDPCWQ
jgi:hypothetical protein